MDFMWVHVWKYDAWEFGGKGDGAEVFHDEQMFGSCRWTGLVDVRNHKKGYIKLLDYFASLEEVQREAERVYRELTKETIDTTAPRDPNAELEHLREIAAAARNYYFEPDNSCMKDKLGWVLQDLLTDYKDIYMDTETK